MQLDIPYEKVLSHLWQKTISLINFVQVLFSMVEVTHTIES